MGPLPFPEFLVVGEDIDPADVCTGTCLVTWDSQSAGVPAGTVGIKINVGDRYNHTLNTTVASPGAIDPASDDIKPNAIDDLVAKARGKSGSVILTWTTPGDDYANNGRAAYFDIRFAEIPIVESGGDGSSAVNFNAIVAEFTYDVAV